MPATQPFWAKRMADVREIGPPLIGKNWAKVAPPRSPSAYAIMRKF